MSTPAHCGHLLSDNAASTEAPEMLLMAFQPVVETIEKTTTRMLPQYPKEYRLQQILVENKKRSWLQGQVAYEKVVIRNPVKPNDAVQAGNRQEIRFTTKMMAKQSKNEMPMLPPSIPVDNVATAMLALNLEDVRFVIVIQH
jgi:hypothetical protein